MIIKTYKCDLCGATSARSNFLDLLIIHAFNADGTAIILFEKNVCRTCLTRFTEKHDAAQAFRLTMQEPTKEMELIECME